jgi:transcriptional regulator with XRE-family HTH domain
MTKTTRSKPRLAAFVSDHIDAICHKKTQREIAEEVGWHRPNMVSMIKRGTVRVPWASVPALAAAIDADPAELFRLAVADYHPEAHLVIGQIFGTIVTENERDFLAELRLVFGGSVPPLSGKIKTALNDALALLGNYS